MTTWIVSGYRSGNMSALDASSLGNQHLLLINKTQINVEIREPYRDSQLNELLYVIVVIVFYATALMTLIVTQIKRQRREGTEVDYYDEYLQRNSEVKHTCQIASGIVARQQQHHHQPSPPPPPALATAAFVAVAAGSILGHLCQDEDEEDDGDVQDAPSNNREASNGKTAHDHVVCGSDGGVGSRIVFPLEKSPKLESILDVES